MTHSFPHLNPFPRDYVPTTAMRRSLTAGFFAGVTTAAFFMPPEWPALALVAALAWYFLFR